jgi:hypothetical protein
MIREQDAVGIDHTLIVASGDEETAMSQISPTLIESKRLHLKQQASLKNDK